MKRKIRKNRKKSLKRWWLDNKKKKVNSSCVSPDGPKKFHTTLLHEITGLGCTLVLFACTPSLQPNHVGRWVFGIAAMVSWCVVG
jgi:hypothetical protein